MKNFLKFSGVIAMVLAIVAIILMMATPVLIYDGTVLGTKVHDEIVGTNAIFGAENTKLAWAALLAWIFVLVAAVVLLAGVVLPLFGIKALQKFAGVLNLCVVCLLVVAGIFMFITKGAFINANNDSWNVVGTLLKDYKMGVGWVIGAILAIAGGVIAILPACVNLVSKK